MLASGQIRTLTAVLIVESCEGH